MRLAASTTTTMIMLAVFTQFPGETLAGKGEVIPVLKSTENTVGGIVFVEAGTGSTNKVYELTVPSQRIYVITVVNKGDTDLVVVFQATSLANGSALTVKSSPIPPGSSRGVEGQLNRPKDFIAVECAAADGKKTAKYHWGIAVLPMK
jgi:hypothetical protein